MFRRFGEILSEGEIGVGVGFEDVDPAITAEAKVDPSETAHIQGPIDPFTDRRDFGGESFGEVLGGFGRNSDFFLVFLVPFYLPSGDRGCSLGEVFEDHFPDGERFEAFIPDDSDVQFASFDVLLGDGIGPDLVVDEFDPFDQFLVAIDDGGLRNSERGIFEDGFDEQGVFQLFGTFDRLSLVVNHEFRGRNPGMGENFFGEGLVAGEHQAAVIAAGVGLSHEFEIGDDGLIVGGYAVKFLEEDEGNVGFPVDDGFPEGAEIVVESDELNLVAHFL